MKSKKIEQQDVKSVEVKRKAERDVKWEAKVEKVNGK